MKQKAHMEKMRREAEMRSLREDIAQRDALISILRGRVRALNRRLREAEA
jgi:hypothetical protein